MIRIKECFSKTIAITCGLIIFSLMALACKDKDEVTAAEPVILVTIDGYNQEDITVLTEGLNITLKIPSYNTSYLPTDLTKLKVTFTVQYAHLKNYDNGVANDFSSPVVVEILNSFYETLLYTVKVEVYVPEAPDFSLSGVSINGITLEDGDVVISGKNITIDVPTLTNAFTATTYTALPVTYNLTYGVAVGFENGASMDYSNKTTGRNVEFKDLSGNTHTYNVKVNPVYRDIGPAIDPVLTYTPINLNWTPVAESLPTGLKLYKVDDYKPGSTTVKTSGYYAELDLSSSSQVKLGVAYTSGAFQNIKNFYTSASNPKPIIITNAGYFGGGTSYSLVVDNGAIKFNNIGSMNRTYNGVSTPYYATRSAFGIMSNGTAEVNWVYNSGGKTYAFDTPVRNDMGQVPLPSPMHDAFSSIRKEWNPVLAVGGAPVLVKNGQVVCSQMAEISDQFQGNRSRTAIGITNENKVILLVLDEKPSPVAGWSLPDLAMIMKTLGCKDALNLDGGGSTAMVLNGSIINQPSDTASEGDSRAIPTVVTITQK